MDRFERLRILQARGDKAFKRMIDESGGILPEHQVLNILQITKPMLRDMISEKRIIALRNDGKAVYPTFQFSDNQLAPNFSRILSLLWDDDPVSQCRFWLTELDCLDGMAPIKAITQPDPYLYYVERSARQFGRHGAK